MPDRTAFAIVDAFTTAHSLSGNPAGVLLLDEFPGPGWMQGEANELAQAETAFLAPARTASSGCAGSPRLAEVALCGHATLACGPLARGVRRPAAGGGRVHTRSGQLTAVRADGRIVLDFPAVPATQVTPSPGLLAALGGPVPAWTGVTDHPDAGERNMLAVLESEDAVRELSPDLQAVMRLPVGLHLHVSPSATKTQHLLLGGPSTSRGQGVRTQPRRTARRTRGRGG